MKILIIEDQPLSMKLVVDILQIAGSYEIFTACDAEEGIAKAREERPEIILMDINLPGIDGIAATWILKGEPRTSGIKVIALTAAAMAGDRELALAAGCDEYIAKPVRYKELLDTVAEVAARMRDDT